MKIFKIVFMILMVAGGAAIGYSVGVYMATDDGGQATPLPLWLKLLVIPDFMLAFFMVLAIHELGHVLAGLGVGFEFRMYTVGPLMIEKEESRLKLKWNRNLNLFGGLSLCIPRSEVRLRENFIVFTAGGPSASLIWTLIAFLCYYSLGFDRGLAWATLLENFFFFSAYGSLFIFLTTIVPMQSGGFYTDGARMLNLGKKGPQSELEIVLLQYTTQSYAGIRPSLLNEQPLLDAIDLPVETPFKAYLHSFLHNIYLDKDNIEKAESQLALYAAYLDRIPKGYHAMVWLDKAWFEAMYHHHPEKAQEYFDKAEIGTVITPSKVLRVEAGIAFANQQYDQASEKATLALKELPKSMDRGLAVAEKEWLEKMIKHAL